MEHVVGNAYLVAASSAVALGMLETTSRARASRTLLAGRCCTTRYQARIRCRRICPWQSGIPMGWRPGPRWMDDRHTHALAAGRPAVDAAAPPADHRPRGGGRRPDRQPDHAPSCSCSRPATRAPTSASTSTVPAARSPPASPSTTRCGSSPTTSPLSQWDSRPPWASSSSARARPASASPCPTRGS